MEHNDPFAWERCEICRFSASPGVCRRHAPIAQQGTAYPLAIWPATDYSDWCGDFVLDQATLDRIKAGAEQQPTDANAKFRRRDATNNGEWIYSTVKHKLLPGWEQESVKEAT